MSSLGLKELNFSLWKLILALSESNLGFRNQFRPHDVDVGHLVVNFNFGPLLVDFKFLRITSLG